MLNYQRVLILCQSDFIKTEISHVLPTGDGPSSPWDHSRENQWQAIGDQVQVMGISPNGYPLVNVNKKLWKITIFDGKIGKSTISMAIFNSYVSLPEANSSWGFMMSWCLCHRRPWCPWLASRISKKKQTHFIRYIRPYLYALAPLINPSRWEFLKTQAVIGGPHPDNKSMSSKNENLGGKLIIKNGASLHTKLLDFQPPVLKSARSANFTAFDTRSDSWTYLKWSPMDPWPNPKPKLPIKSH